MTQCPACDVIGEHNGPIHAYMSPSAGCWARYGEILAREFSNAANFASHRRLVDAYCGHHSIGRDRRARQSLHIHMAGLMLHFEDHLPDRKIRDFLSTAAKGAPDFPWLEPPAASSAVSYDTVYAAQDAAEHVAAVQVYAKAVFEAWAPHHASFRSLIETVRG